MSEFKPNFICPYCEQEIPMTLASPSQGQLGACGCAESAKAWEVGHRAEMERRKRQRGRRIR